MANVIVSTNITNAACRAKAQGEVPLWEKLLKSHGVTGKFLLAHRSDGACSPGHTGFATGIWIHAITHAGKFALECLVFKTNSGRKRSYVGRTRHKLNGVYLGACTNGCGH